MIKKTFQRRAEKKGGVMVLGTNVRGEYVASGLRTLISSLEALLNSWEIHTLIGDDVSYVRGELKSIEATTKQIRRVIENN